MTHSKSNLAAHSVLDGRIMSTPFSKKSENAEADEIKARRLKKEQISVIKEHVSNKRTFAGWLISGHRQESVLIIIAR